MQRADTQRLRLARRPSLDAALAAVIHAMRSDLFTALSEARELQPADPTALTRPLQHLNALLDDLDWRRRLTRGAIAPRPMRCDVGTVLSAIAVEMEARYPECIVVLRCASDLPVAWADSLRLRDVLLLVATFAMQRVKSATPMLEMRAASKSRWIMISLQAALRLSKIEARALFAPLELQPRSALRSGPGLYVARALARQLRGDLRVQAHVNGESALVVAVPSFLPLEQQCRTS